MGFLFVILGIWALAMMAWFMVSKYFKASDIDRVKARLLGTPRGSAVKGKKGAPATSVLRAALPPPTRIDRGTVHTRERRCDTSRRARSGWSHAGSAGRRWRGRASD